jgi:hypothetical protein
MVGAPFMGKNNGNQPGDGGCLYDSIHEFATDAGIRGTLFPEG